MLWIKNYNSCVLSFFPVMVSEIPFEIHACIIYMDLKRNFTDKCSVKFLLRSMNIMDLKRNFTDHLSMYYMLLWDVLSACGWHSWYCTYFKCRRGWSVKWGVGARERACWAGEKKSLHNTHAVSLSSGYYRLNWNYFFFRCSSCHKNWQLLGGMRVLPPSPRPPLSSHFCFSTSYLHS